MNISTKTSASSDDVNYLKKHDIASAVESALASILKSKPENPLDALASELTKHAHPQKPKDDRGAKETVTSKRQKTDEVSADGQKFDYDFIVIGGGSGGMASAKEAAHYGAKVVLFDFVKPSTQGSKWGLGGTCVNVGCIPKKLMHYASQLGTQLDDAPHYGWKYGEKSHDWQQLVSTVGDHIRSLNFGYRNGLRSNQVEYINALAQLASPNSVEYKDKDGSTKTISGRYILIAVGGRPLVPPEIPGAVEHAITSDDVFTLDHPPGKTLVVGGSYVALECGGFLHGVGYDVTIAVRSILLRGYDQQCAEKVGALMEELGIKFKRQVLPKAITKTDKGALQVAFDNGEIEEFNTVLYATGRKADSKGLALDKVGISVEKDAIPVNKDDSTSVPSIFAVGDVVKGVPELTPVHIRTGELLARRLFANDTVLMDFTYIPTTVFSPYEYGCVGLSEEQAEAKYGKDDLEIFLAEWTTLEFAAAHRTKIEAKRENEFDTSIQPTCMSKLICVKSRNNQVVGFHFIGPNAGEVTQGFALTVQMGATKDQFDSLIGIHPTDAEAYTGMMITKASGKSWISEGGCAGGKCG